jgi:S-DNA-T family DNA segregation ATPase FtsK/SpoIIIE
MAKREKDKSSASKKPKGAGKAAKARAAAPSAGLLRPVLGILLGGAGLLVLAGLVSYRPHAAADNWAGPVGHGMSATLLDSLGVGAYALAGFLLLCASALVARRPRLSIFKTFAWATVAFGTMSIAALLIHAHLQGHLPGGVFGALLAGAMRSSLSTVGAALLLFSATAAALVVATDLWALHVAAAAGRMSIAGGAMAVRGAVRAVDLARERAARNAEESAQLEGDEESDEGAEDGSGRGSDDGADDGDDAPSTKAKSAKEQRDLEQRAALLARASIDEAPQDPRLAAGPLIAEPPKKKKPASPTPVIPIALAAAASAAGMPADPSASLPVFTPKPVKNAEKNPDKKAAQKDPAASADKIAAALAPVPAPISQAHEDDSLPPSPVPALPSGGKEVSAKSAAVPTIVEPRAAPKPASAAKLEPKTDAKADAKVDAKVDAKTQAMPTAEKVATPTISVASVAPAARVTVISPEGKIEPEKRQFTLFGGRSAFTVPPIDILTGESQGPIEVDRDALTNTAEKLRATLASHGIQGQVTQIRPGPVVTMFEFLPAAGVKVSRISSLSDDLAMGMKALRVRIIAPIPGKGVVGIEIPNAKRQTVVLKELVEQEAFQKSPSKLAMCLGKDVEGLPYIVDLAKMPHALIAGTTGSGKSVAVNAMIVSMLLRATPEEVRFLMIDPKMLELSVYEGIPHLLLPVVTDSKKAAMALRWAVEEMERRYQLLAECGVRNIAGYNQAVEKDGDRARKAVPPPKPKRVVDLADPNLDVHDLQQAIASGEVSAQDNSIGLRPTTSSASARSTFLVDGPNAVHGGRGAAANGAGASANSTAEWLRAEMQARGESTDLPGDPGPQPAPLSKLPYLVIIIDELADLMMVASREVETYIARLAQMARAAGIHLMVATQRPSTDVVTGVIKANFPTRISFQVASRHDSATIINTPGAENLLGMGDMLIVPPGTSLLTRVHGPYVDEREIHAVVEHWKAQGAPVYDPSILRPRSEDGEDGEGGGQDDEPADELYDQALASLGDMRFISISLLQRKLRVGYNRAARMIERMEKDGVVGPADGAKPREVLIRAGGEMPGIGA